MNQVKSHNLILYVEAFPSKTGSQSDSTFKSSSAAISVQDTPLQLNRNKCRSRLANKRDIENKLYLKCRGFQP